MVVLARLLEPHVKGMPVRILTSPAPFARESASILGSVLLPPLPKVVIEAYDILCPSVHEPANFKGTHGLVRCSVGAAQAMVLVTHDKHLRGFVDYYAKHELGCPAVRTHLIDPGEAWVLDCVTCNLARVSAVQTVVHA